MSPTPTSESNGSSDDPITSGVLASPVHHHQEDGLHTSNTQGPGQAHIESYSRKEIENINGNIEPAQNQQSPVDSHKVCFDTSHTSPKPTKTFNFKNNFRKLCMTSLSVEVPQHTDGSITDSSGSYAPCSARLPHTDNSSLSQATLFPASSHTPALPRPQLKRGIKFHLSDQKYVASKTQAIKQDVEKAAQQIERAAQTEDLGRHVPYVPLTNRRGNRCLHLLSDVEDNAPPHRKSKMLNEEEMKKYMKKYNFKEREVIEYEEAFLVFDLDVDGVITVDELGTVMVALGQRPSLEEIQALIQGVDSDNSGTVDFDEFLGMMSARMHSDPEQELKEVFGVFDSDSDGYISAYELYDVLSRLDDSITRDEVDFMIKEADTNGDGKVDFPEFKNILHGK